jgi:hypothetical protein
MTRDELVERLLWAVDGYRFKYLSRAEMINRITRLIDETFTEEVDNA